MNSLQKDQELLANTAWKKRKPIQQGGLLKYVHDSEYHAFNPDVVQQVQKAVTSGDYEEFRKYSKLVNERPVATLRDLMQIKSADQPSASG